MDGCSVGERGGRRMQLGRSWLNIGQPIRYGRDHIEFHVMRYYTSFWIDLLVIGSLPLHCSRLQLMRFYVDLVADKTNHKGNIWKFNTAKRPFERIMTPTKYPPSLRRVRCGWPQEPSRPQSQQKTSWCSCHWAPWRCQNLRSSLHHHRWSACWNEMLDFTIFPCLSSLVDKELK